MASELIGDGNKKSRRILPDEGTWPVIEHEDDIDSVEWRLRYAPAHVTREDMLFAASVLSAYGYLVYEASREKVALVRRELRAGRREEAIR